MNFSKKLTYLASVLSLVAMGGCEITVTTDFDGDGIEDGVDDCPGTSLADAVDAFGCSLEDDDADGVRNQMDACPLEAGTLANGCNEIIVNDVGTLDGRWLINGVAASAELCTEAGIANVRFNVNTVDGVGDASWTMPCSNLFFDSSMEPTEPTIEFNVAYPSGKPSTRAAQSSTPPNPSTLSSTTLHSTGPSRTPTSRWFWPTR